jgi:prophage regulatory protein
VLIARMGRKRSTLYVDIRDGLLTPQVAIGSRAVGWPDYEIDALIEARIAGATEDEIRELVKKLVADRTRAAGSR